MSTSQARNARGRRRGSAGFTFIEVLIVMGIIATLVGLSVVVIQLMGKKGPEMRTQSTVSKVSAYVGQWKQRFEAYPPSRIDDLPRFMDAIGEVKGTRSPENEGIEALYQALKGRGANIEVDFNEDEMANLDEDALDSPITRDGNPQLFEIIDAWGNPLIYMSARDYGRYDQTPMRVILGMGDREGEVVDVQPWRNEETGAHAQQDTYQVFSMGADGEPNTDDDIRYWQQ